MYSVHNTSLSLRIRGFAQDYHTLYKIYKDSLTEISAIEKEEFPNMDFDRNDYILSPTTGDVRGHIRSHFSNMV